MLSLTFAELETFGPCNLEARRAWFKGRKRLTVRTALRARATAEDILWVAGQLGRKDLCVKFALLCAQRVAHLNPDPRVQAALDATQAWLDAPTEANADAAKAANAAAWAADAASWAAEKAEQRKILIRVFSGD